MPDNVKAANFKSHGKNKRRITLLILGIYALLAVVMTWPAMAKLGTELAGGRSDLWIHQWTFWWVKEALQSGQNPFFTTQLYFPQGVSLTSHNIAWLNIAAWLPLQALVGSTAAYNLIIISIFALNGFCFYLFARELTRSLPGSFVGGLVFGFWPYTMSHYDHPNMILIFWVPLTLLLIHRTFKKQTLLYALLAGVTLALIGISRWQLLVMSAPILIGYVFYLFISDKVKRTRRVVVLLLGGGLLAMLLMAPLAAPLIRDQLSRESSNEVDVVELEGGTDLLSYVISPETYNHYWQDAIFRLPLEYPYQNIAASFNYVPFLGYLTLLLALYGTIKKWKKSWFWALLALVYFLLALGPTLTIDAAQFAQVPVPYRLLVDSLIDVLIRRPHRLNLFLSLPVAMLVSWAVVDLIEIVDGRFPQRGPWLAATTAAILGLVILWENPIRPFPTTSTDIPAWYQQLAVEPEQFGILELPTYERGFDKLYMFYQTQHGKPISGGHVSRLPVDADAFRASIPFLRPMLRQDSWLVQPEEWVDFAEVDVARQFRELAEANIRYVVVNKNLLNEGNLERWQDWVTMRPSYEDETVLVYTTTSELGAAMEINQDFAGGIGLYKWAFQPIEANQAGTLKLDLRWASEKAPDVDYEVCVSLINSQGVEGLRQCKEIAPGFPTSQWAANEMVRGSYVLPLDGTIEPGMYDLALFLSVDGDQQVGETAVLGAVQVHPFQPQFDSTTCWDDKICLQGFDIQQSLEALELTTFWQAEKVLDSSNKLFVHVVDQDSGEVVAQIDTIPRRWTYPTDIWEVGEIVRDPLILSLENVVPGNYSITLGWYNVDSGERLHVCSSGACNGDAADVHELTGIEVKGD